MKTQFQNLLPKCNLHRYSVEALNWAVAQEEYSWEGYKQIMCGWASWAGQLEVLKWARERGCPWGDTCINTVTCGRLEILKFARAAGCPWNKSECLYFASLLSSPEVLSWVEGQPD